MSIVTWPMASPNPLKRTYGDTGLDNPPQEQGVNEGYIIPTDFVSTQGSTESELAPVTGARHKVNPQSLSSNDVSLPSTSAPDPPVSGTVPPTKKAKPTLKEMEILRIKKEFKLREKAEEKAKKDQEKAKKEQEKAEEKAKKEQEKAEKEREKAAEKVQREEEKRVKDAVKEEKRKAREEQARLKQEEKQQKEEEKNKKARNQLRLNAFFLQPSMPNGISSGSPTAEHSPLSSRRSSISEIHALEAPRRSRSLSTTPHKAQLPDYERQFPPFFLQSHTSLAPHNRFSRDQSNLQHAEDIIDGALRMEQGVTSASQTQDRTFNVNDLLHISSVTTSRRQSQQHSVKDIVAELDGTTTNPVDLTESHSHRAKIRPLDKLKRIPLKFLKFSQDVRPPYVGTYTHITSRHLVAKLARKPFSRGRPDTNYDYDSEAEWEEPLDGEDLNSEGEEEEDDDEEGNDMDGFLDDEDAIATKRKPLMGNTEPICSGLCWEGPGEQLRGAGIADIDRRLLRLDILLENPHLPIDPYSPAYWPNSTPSRNQQSQGSAMQPPRVPLHPVNRQNTLLPPSGIASGTMLAKPDSTKPTKVHRLIPPDLMDDFKAAVQGNDLTKMGIIEVLKKQFPKQSKDAIRDTLEMVAERIGPTKLDKKWMLKSGF